MSIFEKLYNYRDTILELAIRDFQSRYVGTMLGPVWAITHPIAIIVVFYIVFAIGFKAKAPDDVPFILWFAVGLMAWFYFNDGVLTTANCIVKNAYLVKKTLFPIELLVPVQILSALISHILFLGIIFVVVILNGIEMHFFRLNVFYFLFCSTLLIVGLGWLISSLEAFLKDISQILPIILNLWFWITPIVWDSNILPPQYRFIFDFNPLFYIIEGYRGMLIYAEPRWPNVNEAIYFWCLTILILSIGAMVFRRLRSEFADVI